MQRTLGSSTRTSRIKPGPARFARLCAEESTTAALLQGCPVVTTDGEKIGSVDHLMVDVLTQQLCYVMLKRRRLGAVVALPWHTVYFDAAMGRLVYYTWV